ncbi:hypothetical protein SVIRM249S_04861 [Streptomyces viridochromogenes]|jgi:hypothetical protein
MFSLTLYKRDVSAHSRPDAGPERPVSGRFVTTGLSTTVKTTMIHTIANPRRTKLAHLDSAGELRLPEQPEHSLDLPAQTANPKRTILQELPATTVAG